MCAHIFIGYTRVGKTAELQVACIMKQEILSVRCTELLYRESY